MPAFDLKKFKTDARAWMRAPWGGGHTPETVPTARGWRSAPPSKLARGIALIGQRGRRGCATVRQMSDGRLDVALYSDKTPEDVRDLSLAGETYGEADSYVSLREIPGWGLTVVRLVEALRRDTEAYERGGDCPEWREAAARLRALRDSVHVDEPYCATAREF